MCLFSRVSITLPKMRFAAARGADFGCSHAANWDFQDQVGPSLISKYTNNCKYFFLLNFDALHAHIGMLGPISGT